MQQSATAQLEKLIYLKIKKKKRVRPIVWHTIGGPNDNGQPIGCP